MEPFVTHRGRVALLDWSDVNTDLIIPARYLKRIERTGYGPLLFADKRYEAGKAPEADAPEVHGTPLPDFPLNRPEAEGASILVVGPNFGCGSSREHAVWAVAQAGFRAVVAKGKDAGFADIFEGNAYNNGLLPLELSTSDWDALADAIRASAQTEVTIDLQNLTLTVHGSSGDRVTKIDVPEGQRQRLLQGLDFIAETLQHDAEISRHEQGRPAWLTPTLA